MGEVYDFKKLDSGDTEVEEIYKAFSNTNKRKGKENPLSKDRIQAAEEKFLLSIYMRSPLDSKSGFRKHYETELINSEEFSQKCQ